MSRKIVITGGSSGLGLGLARALTRRGDKVALVARDERKLNEAAASIQAEMPGMTVLTRAIDVRRGGELGGAFEALAAGLGGIDVLINSAGILREGHFETIDESVHREIMDINYFGALNAVRAALPHLKRSTQGHIVNISSISGLTGVFGYSAYCASKYALLGLSETLRFEFAPQGLKVQVVCPGEFDSPMVDALNAGAGRSPENRVHTLSIPKIGVDVVVRDTVHGMEGNAFMIVPGKMASLAVVGLRHFPDLSRKVGDRRIRAVVQGPAPMTK